jgi:hypothetical protein
MLGNACTFSLTPRLITAALLLLPALLLLLQTEAAPNDLHETLLASILARRQLYV